jgi:phosphoglycerate dehydrogenase-like enzyme
VTQRPKVIVDPHFRAMGDVFSASDLGRLAETVDVVWGRDEPMPIDAFREALPEAFAIVSGGWRYGPVLDEAPSLRAILTVSGGWPPEVEYTKCRERGIRVLSAAPAFANAVAELALGLALSCGRDIVGGDRDMRTGAERWLAAADGLDTFLLFEKRVGFVGFGNIGRRLRTLIEPFGCALCAYDPWLTDAYLIEEGVEPTSLERLLETCRVIFVLAAPTSENRALLSRELLERIGSDAVLVLVSRAHVVDFDAVTELVLAGRFRAAIDVFPSEPLPVEHPIRTARGAVLSPHRAGLVQEALWEIGARVVDDLEAMVRGLPPRRLQAAEPELAARYVRTTTLVAPAGAAQ